MKKRNQILAIALVAVLIVSIFIVGTVADTKNTSITISVDKTELLAGETATVTVKATTDYPVATASIPVFYDKTKVTVSNANAKISGYDVANITTDLTAINTDKVYANTSVSSEKYGFVLVTYIGGANKEVSAFENATVLTFTITAKEAVSGDAILNCISASAKTEDNVEGMLYFGTTTSGNIITSIPENVEDINVENAAATVKIVQETQLVGKPDKDTVVDYTNKYIYGIIPGEAVENYFTVTNGSYELVANDLGKTNGTGAIVKVKNENGTVIDTYTIIIFGDVNGDGSVSASDYSAMVASTQGVALEGIAAIAGNVADVSDINNPDISASDYSAVIQSTQGTTLTANPYAE